MIQSWAKQPMVQFLITGGVLAALWWLVLAPESQDPKRIDVSARDIERFIQFRTRNFSTSASERFAAMTPSAKHSIINDYVREEALYRHALSLGLDDSDYVIRQRLVQKVDFIANEQPVSDPTEAELKAFFEARRDEFQTPALVTFAHVFLRSQTKGDDSIDEASANLAHQRAVTMLAFLNNDAVPAHSSTQYGDRFPYRVNYVEQSEAVVASHMGQSAAYRIFELPVSDAWQGPIESDWGVHLIYKQAHLAAVQPDFLDIAQSVEMRWREEARIAARRLAAEQVLQQYEVVIGPDLEGMFEAP